MFCRRRIRFASHLFSCPSLPILSCRSATSCCPVDSLGVPAANWYFSPCHAVFPHSHSARNRAVLTRNLFCGFMFLSLLPFFPAEKKAKKMAGRAFTSAAGAIKSGMPPECLVFRQLREYNIERELQLSGMNSGAIKEKNQER